MEWVREELIHSRFIYFHSYCLEPVSPIKKLGRGRLDHSVTETAPIKEGIIVEQGPLIADGHPSKMRAGRWPLGTGPPRVLERVIRKGPEGQEQGGTRLGCCQGAESTRKDFAIPSCEAIGGGSSEWVGACKH